MTHYDIDPAATRFDVRFHPGLPGMGARVTGVRGSFEATVGPDGAVDLSRPVSGEFSLAVDELETGTWLVTIAVRRWLGQDEQVAARGVITDVAPDPDADDAGTYRLGLDLTMKGETHHLVATGHVTPNGEGPLEVTGGLRVHPSEVGMPLPSFSPPTVEVAWHLVLLPRPD